MSIQSTTAPSLTERRFDRSSWLSLTIGLAILSLGVSVIVASYGIPADGWLVNRSDWGRYTNPVYLTSLPGINSNLRSGDILLAIEGEPFEHLEARAAVFRPRRPDNWEIGETIQYAVLRDGIEVVVPVTLQRPPLALGYRPGILLHNLSLLSTHIYLLMGVLLFMLRPRERAAQLLFLFSIAFLVDDLVSYGSGTPPGVADLFSPVTYWPRIVLGNLLWFLFILPVLVHLFLIFPLPKRLVRRNHLIIPLVYGVSFAGALFYVLLSVSGYFVSGITYSFIFVIPYIVVIAISLIHSLLTIKEPVPRMQMRWIAFGGIIGVLGPMLFYFLRALILGNTSVMANDPGSIWFGLGYLLISAVLPVSLFVAVLRYRLWDIDIIINRSLVYSTLTAIVALIYFSSIVLLQTLFRAITGQASPVAIVLSTLLIAGLFSPLRRQVQQLIDRHFYRRKYNAEQILGQFAMSVRDETDLKKLTSELQKVVKLAIQPEHVSVWLKHPAGMKRK